MFAVPHFPYENGVREMFASRAPRIAPTFSHDALLASPLCAELASVYSGRSPVLRFEPLYGRRGLVHRALGSTKRRPSSRARR